MEGNRCIKHGTPATLSEQMHNEAWIKHTHTHTHTRSHTPVSVRCIYSLPFPILERPSSRTPQEQWAACKRRGPSGVNCPSLVRDGHVFCSSCMFFCWGS